MLRAYITGMCPYLIYYGTSNVYEKFMFQVARPPHFRLLNANPRDEFVLVCVVASKRSPRCLHLEKESTEIIK